MKKMRSLLSIVIALNMVLTVPMGAAAYDIGNSPKSAETAEPNIDGISDAQPEWKSDDDLWGEISDLEYFSHAVTVDDYRELMPRVEQLVLSSPDYEEGSLRYDDGALYWEINDDPKCYDPVIRAQMNGSLSADPQPLTIPEVQDKLPASSGYILSDSGIKRSSAFPVEGAVDVCAFMPYSGTTKDNFSSLAGVAEKVAGYTGGEALCYYGEDATVDKLADAVESCAMVMIGSHGNSGAFGIITNEGITQEDKDSGHYADWGAHYYYNNNNEKTLDYNLWMIDGTIIANHMTKDAPGNFVYSSSCMSMKTDLLCAPLREKGVSAVFGWSESVTSEGDCLDLSILTDLLCSRKTLADAFVEMKKTVGCDWDPTWTDYTYYQARNSAVAFPIIVSEVDEYPGEGKVNDIQTVNSTWKLPVRSDVPEKQVISLNTQYTDYVVAETRHKIKNVTIAAGGLPKGMSMSHEDNRVVLNGKPTQKGYSVATYKITTEKNETITKPVGILTADYTNVTNYSKTVEYMAPFFKKYSGDAFLDASNSKEAKYVLNIPLEFETSSGMFAAVKSGGCLPFSLEFGFDEQVKGSGYIRSQHSRVYSEARGEQYKDYYHVTAPGQYEVKIDFITKTGEVFRYIVNITIKENMIYTDSEKELTYYINDDVSLNIRDWSAGAVTSVHILEGELPPGIILANSWDKPFGFYGTASTAGDYTVKFRMANYSDYYDYTYTFHIKPALLKIKGSAKNVGDTVKLDINRDLIPFENYTITWEVSQDKKVWVPVETNEPEGQYTLPSGYAKWYVRAAVNEIINGKTINRRHFSDIRYINPLPELSGTVFYTSGIASNMKITTARGGLLNNLSNKEPEKLHYQWQKMGSDDSDWTDIDGANGLNFTPTDKMIGTQIRVKATYDGYSGAVYSTPREIHKRVNENTPFTPSVATEEPYTSVTVMNAKADQEYVVMYAVGSPDWTNAKHPDVDGVLKLECDKDTTAYIYTRMRETETSQYGMRVAYKAVYNGHIEYLQGLTFDKTSITTKVGDVTKLTVTPIPEDFSGWDSSYKVSWFVNGSAVMLFEDEDCLARISTSTPISNKTVYVKGISPTSYVNVGAEKTVGYNDIKVAFCSVEVADEDGDFVLRSLDFDDLTVVPGEITTVNYTTYPSPAKVGKLSFEKNSGPDSEIAITESGENDGAVNIVVPDDAQVGVYYYGIKVEGMSTSALMAIKITVQPAAFDVTLDSNNGSGITITNPVKNGADYSLPDRPESFDVPEGCDFDGWDKGAVGSKISVTEDISLKAQWKPHEHTMVYVPRVEPTCTASGMEEHYRCLVCGKLFEDAEGNNEAPTADFFELPPKGHTPGVAVKENIIDADCEHDGSFESVVYCKECGTELSRTVSVIPALGHKWGAPVWTWEGLVATATFTCENDPTHVESVTTTDIITDTADCPHCDWNLPIYYEAYVEFDGKHYSGLYEYIVPATGHRWYEHEWVWNGHDSAKLVFECDYCYKTTDIDAEITSAVTVEPTEESEGVRTYTAKVILGDTVYTDEITEVIPKLTPNEPVPDKPTPDDPEPDKPTPDEPTPVSNGLLGDVNKDGVVDSADALAILRNSVGLETFTDEQKLLGDVNGDGTVDSSDALAVLRFSVGLNDNENIGKPLTKAD